MSLSNGVGTGLPVCNIWRLAAAAVPLRAASIQSLFDADPERPARCTADGAGLRTILPPLDHRLSGRSAWLEWLRRQGGGRP